jgi:hypothetical protein
MKITIKAKIVKSHNKCLLQNGVFGGLSGRDTGV